MNRYKLHEKTNRPQGVYRPGDKVKYTYSAFEWDEEHGIVLDVVGDRVHIDWGKGKIILNYLNDKHLSHE